MKVLVTGGAGGVGKPVVDRLVRNGFEVKVIDLAEGLEIPGAVYASCNILDYSGLRAQVQGCDAVVHLAAYASPSVASSDRVFQTNVQGTFNVFKACEETGIRRVVQASSINALGLFYGTKPAPIHYLPVDEDHPCVTTDAYSLSKHMIEEIGDYYWRRSGISNVALRFPYVAPVTFYATINDRRDKIQEFCDHLKRQTIEQRQRWFEKASAQFNQIRLQGALENREIYQQSWSSLDDEFRTNWMVMSNRVNLWACVDARDAAQAVEKGLVANFEGSYALFINDDHNFAGIPSLTLAELFYPDVKTFKKALADTDSLVSIDRARRLLGFEVEYSFGI